MINKNGIIPFIVFSGEKEGEEVTGSGADFLHGTCPHFLSSLTLRGLTLIDISLIFWVECKFVVLLDPLPAPLEMMSTRASSLVP